MANSAYELLVMQTACKFYREYGNSAEWKNFQGDPMPIWQDLPPYTKEHWIAVAHKAIEEFVPEIAVIALKDR